MNENIDLTKILKDCPKGWTFYSTILGNVEFQKIEVDKPLPIVVNTKACYDVYYKENGYFLENFDGECTLFPSKEQRDWSKFTAPWYKKEKFDPKTLKPFDKVLVKDKNEWACTLFSHIVNGHDYYKYECCNFLLYRYCIPYNDDTKHLVGTTEEAPEYYRYWED